MLTLPPGVRIYVSVQPVDLRKSFDGLAALTREILKQDPVSGHLFVFRNREGHRAKVLFWDRTGFILLYKRLEGARFRFPQVKADCLEVDAVQLRMLLDGIELGGAWGRTGT